MMSRTPFHLCPQAAIQLWITVLKTGNKDTHDLLCSRKSTGDGGAAFGAGG